MRAGQWVVVALLGVPVVMGVALFYLQDRFFYHRVTDVTSVEIGGESFSVSAYDGLDNDGRPLRLRGCFQLDDPAAALAAGEAAPDAEPFDAPDWFECWDAAALDADLAAGRAQVVIAEAVGIEGFVTQRLVAIYPDGRAYQWRRILEVDG